MTNVYQEFKQIPREELTSIICLNYIKKDPRIVTVIPKDLINDEIITFIINNAPSLLSKIPRVLITEDLLKDAITKKPALISFIPNSLLTEEFCKKLLIDNPLLIKFLKKELLTEEIVLIPLYYYFNSASVLQEIFSYIPGNLISKEFLEKLINNNIKATRVIPYHKLEEETRYYIVNYILSKDKEYAHKYIPKKYLPTSEIIETIPKRNIEEESLELSIIKELTTILNEGGSIEKIAQKYNISTTKITNIIEKQQNENPDFYNAIKNKLIANQTTWVINMENDYQTLENILFSLNLNNTNQLSREQKIKFAYLYNKLCKNTLEDIYTYISRFQNSKTHPTLLKTFFRKILKYNFLKDERFSIPEKKAIIYNNRWLKPFNLNEYFKIKNGIPTAKNMYLEHEITINVVNNVIEILNEYNIPLNDLIVKEAIREYYNNHIEDYISQLKSYEIEIEKNKTK